jgi:hypothetical protein
MTCNLFETTLPAYVYDELGAEDRAGYDAHVAECEACRHLVDEARRLRQVMDQRSEIELTPNIVVRCRQALEKRLDREQVGWRALLENWFGAAGNGANRLSKAAMLTPVALGFFGFSVGWILRSHSSAIVATGKPAISSVVGADLANLNVKSISQVTPDPRTGDVRITVNAERRMTLEGSLDDPHIRELLVNTVKGYENPGIRRDALDALRSKSDQPAIREALIFAMRKDPNAGDRLDALKAIQTIDWGSDVHQALLAAAEHDKNPGVRFAAMDTLVNRAVREKDTALLPVLQSLAAGHSNAYIRVRCAQAIHELTEGDRQP